MTYDPGGPYPPPNQGPGGGNNQPASGPGYPTSGAAPASGGPYPPASGNPYQGNLPTPASGPGYPGSGAGYPGVASPAGSDPYQQGYQQAYQDPYQQGYGQPGYQQGYQQQVVPGYGQPAFDPVTGQPLSEKTKLTAGLLSILLGGFGVGRFYLGYPGLGVLQIVATICTAGVGAIWGLIEGIIILANNSIPDSEGRKLRDD